MKFLFKNAKVIDVNSPYHGEIVDLLVEDDVIVSIDNELVTPEDVQIIELAGASLTTGFAELHSDLGEPGNEESETLTSGATAAALSGYTAVGVVSNGRPWNDTKTGVEYILSKGEQLPIHLIPVGCMSKGRNGEELSEMFEMHEAGTSLFGDFKQGVENANLLKLALLYSRPFGRIMVHPENNNLSGSGQIHEGASSTYFGLKGIPEIAESVQVNRDLALAEYTSGAIHIASISLASSVESVRKAKANGINVTCSVNVHHLLFTDEDLEGYPTDLKVNPPLRTKEDQEALLLGLQDGTIDCLTIDHLPKDVEQKMCEFDNAAFGMAGFEGALAHFIDRVELSDERLQAVLSTAPRLLLGLPELKIIEGEVADFTIFQSSAHLWTGFASAAHNNPFRGSTTRTSIVGIFTKGRYLASH